MGEHPLPPIIVQADRPDRVITDLKKDYIYKNWNY